MRVSKLAAVVVLVLTVVGCKPKVPSQYIQPDDMEDILYDYHLSQAMARQRMSNAEGMNYESNLYFLSVLQKYGIDEAQFDSSLVYYYTRADRFQKIYARVNERLSAQAKAIGASVGEIGKYTAYSTTGDTANIWRDANYALLMPAAPYNRLDFVVKADTAFHLGDSFLLQFTTSYVSQSSSKDAVAYIKMRYDNDSVYTVSTHVSPSGVTQMRVPKNETVMVKDITGFIHLVKTPDDAKSLKLMYIDQLQLIRFHNKITPKPATDDEKNSVQPADSNRQATDSVRGGDRGAMREKVLSAPSGTPPDRVAPRSTHP